MEFVKVKIKDQNFNFYNCGKDDKGILYVIKQGEIKKVPMSFETQHGLATGILELITEEKPKKRKKIKDEIKETKTIKE